MTQTQPKKPRITVNYLASQGYVYLCSQYVRRLGHETLFYTDGKAHPHLSLGWFCQELGDEDVSRIRFEELLTTSPLGLNVQARDILKKVSACDVLHCGELYAVWAALSGKPFIYQPFGGDINIWPFKDDTEAERLRAFFIRLILDRADIIWGGSHQKEMHASLTDLGVDTGKFTGFQLPIDADFHAPSRPEERMETRQRFGGRDCFTVLLASQLMIHPLPHLNYSKGSDLFARAVKILMDRAGKENVAFWIIDKGPQRKEVREYVEGIGLGRDVTWIPAQNKINFVRLLNACDVVLDQIYPPCGTHGALALEAMSCAKPTVLYIDEDYRRNVSKEPLLPNVQAQTDQEVAEQLFRLYADPEERDRIGQASRQCILEHYHWPAAAKRLVEVYREAIKRRVQRQP